MGHIGPSSRITNSEYYTIPRTHCFRPIRAPSTATIPRLSAANQRMCQSLSPKSGTPGIQTFRALMGPKLRENLGFRVEE